MLQKIIVIGFIVSSIADSLPDIYCNPFFGTITRLVNGSYFIGDERGNYWIVDHNEKLTEQNRKGNIRYFADENLNLFNASNFFTFDLTFIVNFDLRCNSHEEHFYGFKFFNGRNTSYTKYHSHKWQPIKSMTSNNMGSDFLDHARGKLLPNRRIGAVLTVKPVGVIIIQDSDTTYVYCNSTSGWKWDKEQQYIEFKNNDSISFSEIYGGFVDNDNRVAYLFPADRSSSNHYIRKVFYKCDIHIEKKPKLTLICEKQSFKSLCVLPSFWQRYMIIVISFTVIAFIIILAVCIGLCYYLCTKERKLEIIRLQNDEKIELNRKRRF